MGLLDNERLELNCPHCRKAIKQTIGWFKQSGHSCPGCGAALETKEFKRSIEDVERQLKNFGSSFK